MQRKIGTVLTFVCGLVIAAHFLKAGNLLMAGAGLLSPFLLFIQKPQAARIVQFLLVAAALEWVLTILDIASRRVETGEPWIRMAAILGGVALFNIFTAFLIRMKANEPEKESQPEQTMDNR